MCLGIPGRLVERLEAVGGLEHALVEFGELRRRVCTAFVPDARPGEFVVVHAGIAISTINAEEAERVRKVLERMGEPTAPGTDDEIP